MQNGATQKPRILIIDDEPFVRDILSDLLSENYDCLTASSGTEAKEIIGNEAFNVVLSDIDLGDASGLDIVPQILESSPDTSVVMISGNQTIDHAIEAMRAGAFDYIRKPFDLNMVELAVERALDHNKLLANQRRYENDLEQLVKQRTDQLQHLAYHDPLTDLPNRVLLEDRLARALIAERRNGRVALMFVALDNLKKIQDTLGHSAAEKALKIIAGRLAKAFDDPATVSRIDGDEFAILVPQLVSDEEVVSMVADINALVNQVIELDENEIYLTASIGVSMYPADGGDPETLLKKSGAALLRAREKGGNNCQYYTNGMNAAAVKRLAMENGLRRSVERGELDVQFQPKVNVDTGTIKGFEALVRWNHPEFGPISPAEFIPIAEDTGIIVALGHFVLRRACGEAKKLVDAGYDITIAVNFSLRQLQQPNVADNIRLILEETGLPPEALNLEITESSIMSDPTMAVETLTRLKEIGISISLDDFGTGYSSLAHLKRLPIDVLKIDRSFVCDSTTDADDAALIMAMVTLAHNLHLDVVAEGIETEMQLQFLRLLRCNEYQGFYFSRPVPASDLLQMLRENH